MYTHLFSKVYCQSKNWIYITWPSLLEILARSHPSSVLILWSSPILSVSSDYGKTSDSQHPAYLNWALLCTTARPEIAAVFLKTARPHFRLSLWTSQDFSEISSRNLAIWVWQNVVSQRVARLFCWSKICNKLLKGMAFLLKIQHEVRISHVVTYRPHRPPFSLFRAHNIQRSYTFT